MLNEIIISGIAIALGLLGAYFTNWERKIYEKYFKYVLPTIGVFAILFLVVDQEISKFLFYILIMGISWVYSTKFWFSKK